MKLVIVIIEGFESEGGSIKSDLVQLCQSFKDVDHQFSALLARLESVTGQDKEAAGPLCNVDDDVEEEEEIVGEEDEEESTGGDTSVSSQTVENCDSTGGRLESVAVGEERAAAGPSDKGEEGVREPTTAAETSRTEALSSSFSASSECFGSDGPTTTWTGGDTGRADGPGQSTSSEGSQVESISWESKVEAGRAHAKPVCDNSSDNVEPSGRPSVRRDFILTADDSSVDLTSRDESFGHYEECSVSSTLTFVAPPVSGSCVESEEALVVMTGRPDQQRELSQLERNIGQAEEVVGQALYLQDTSSMEDELSRIQKLLGLLADVFVPANLTDDESAAILARLVKVKEELRGRDQEGRALNQQLNQMNEEISGLSLWMKEVGVFLEAEEAALGDLDTLDAQLKESNALQVSCPSSLIIAYFICSSTFVFNTAL